MNDEIARLQARNLCDSPMSEGGGTFFVVLPFAVSMAMEELESRGGPSDEDLEWAGRFGSRLAHQGDALMYRTKPSMLKFERCLLTPEGGVAPQLGTAGLFSGMARAVAILAFMPGGVTLFGEHYEAEAGR